MTTKAITVNLDEKISQYEEKLDRHVDQLEEDIAYFNEKLTDIIGKWMQLESEVKVCQDKIDRLEDKYTWLEGFTHFLETKLMEMEKNEENRMS